APGVFAVAVELMSATHDHVAGSGSVRLLDQAVTDHPVEGGVDVVFGDRGRRELRVDGLRQDRGIDLDVGRGDLGGETVLLGEHGVGLDDRVAELLDVLDVLRGVARGGHVAVREVPACVDDVVEDAPIRIVEGSGVRGLRGGNDV